MLPTLPALLLAALPDCSALAAWQAGRSGVAAASGCAEASYDEAHRLGTALLELQRERAALAAQLARVEARERAALRRRQRQLDVDLEAIRGLAVLRGWPLAAPPEHTP